MVWMHYNDYIHNYIEGMHCIHYGVWMKCIHNSVNALHSQWSKCSAFTMVWMYYIQNGVNALYIHYNSEGMHCINNGVNALYSQ